MRPISESFRSMLRRSHRSAARVTVLDPLTFATLGVLSGAQGYVIEGSVAMVAGRIIRRTCDLRIANPDGVWTPEPLGSWLSTNSLLRLERGIWLDEQSIEWVTLGHFLIGRPRVDQTAQGSALQVQGEDRAKLLVRSRFTLPSTWPVGTRLASVIGAEAQIAGMGTDRYRLDDQGKTLAMARTFEQDEPRADALAKLAHDYGLELYADADGYLALSVPPDPETAALAWTYEAGPEAIHVAISKEWTDDRLYNHVICTGENADPALPIVRAEVADTNPASPTFVNGPLGDRVYRYTSAMITSAAQANEVAINLLRSVALIEESIELVEVTNPALEPGDAIEISDPVTRTSGRWLLDQVNTPLGRGEQTIGARVARSLGSMPVIGRWWAEPAQELAA